MDAERIVDAWNEIAPVKYPRKRADLLEIIVSLNHKFTDEIILNAISNYAQALRIPESKAFHHSLPKFLTFHLKDYIDGAFVLRNYDPRTFGEKRKPTPKELRAKYAREQEAERKRHREQYHEYFNSLPVKELEKCLMRPDLVHVHWLIHEILDEKG